VSNTSKNFNIVYGNFICIKDSNQFISANNKLSKIQRGSNLGIIKKDAIVLIYIENEKTFIFILRPVRTGSLDVSELKTLPHPVTYGGGVWGRIQGDTPWRTPFIGCGTHPFYSSAHFGETLEK
jgi:hypothetical protein